MFHCSTLSGMCRMYILTFCTVIIFIYYHNVSSCLIQDTELLFTYMVNVHGDRTPLENECQYSNDPKSLANLIKPYGYGAITDAGKKCAYNLGTFIRTKYSSLLPPTFDPSVIHVRSTYTSRTIVTALCATAAMYCLPEDQWMTTMDWPVIPYSTILPKYDYLVPFINCPVYMNAYDALSETNILDMVPLEDSLSKILHSPSNTTLSVISDMYDLFCFQQSLGLSLGDEIEKLLPQIKLVATKAMKITLGDDQYLAMETGVLLNEFMDMASKAISGEKIPKMFLYSAHDFNVYSLMAATQIVPCISPPDFGALYALEFRKDPVFETYYVVPMYLSSPGAPAINPVINGCGTMCEYNKFISITSKYALNINDWRTRCGWNDNLDITECSIE